MLGDAGVPRECGENLIRLARERGLKLPGNSTEGFICGLNSYLMLVGAYLLGSIPAAYLGVKWFKGADIRKLGTGNVGSSNVARTTSKWLAVPVGSIRYGQRRAGVLDSPPHRPYGGAADGGGLCMLSWGTTGRCFWVFAAARA